MTVAQTNAPVTKADRESVITKSARFARVLRPQATQSVRTPIKPREAVFISAMLAALRRWSGKTSLKGRSLDSDYPAAGYLEELFGSEPEDRVRVARCRPDLPLV